MNETNSNSKNLTIENQNTKPSKKFELSDKNEDSHLQDVQPNDMPAAIEEDRSEKVRSKDASLKEIEKEPISTQSDLSEDIEKENQQNIKQTITVDSTAHLSAIGKADNVNYILESKEKIPKDAPFADPTIPLPEKPAKLPLFDSPDEIDSYIEELKGERILVINCYDENIALAAAYSIVENIDYTKKYEKRMLVFDGSNANRSDLHLGIFIDQKIGDGRKVIVIISLKSQKFMDSMFSSAIYASHVRGELGKRDMMLVCMGNAQIIQEDMTGSQSHFHFPQWKITFLPHLLNQHFSREEASYLYEKIQLQRKDGFWDENENEREFFELVSTYLRNGIENFRKSVEERDHVDKTEYFKQRKKIMPKDQIKDGAPLHNTVIYVATFFPGLSPLDFSHIVLLLLGDKKTTVDKESRVIDEQKIVKIVKSQNEKRLSDIWEENPDKIMRECFLQTNLAEDHSAVVDFSPSFSRNSCKDYLVKAYPMFLRQQFARIQTSGLLFDFDATAPVIDNVIRISAEMAVSDPTYYGKDWLIGIVIGLKQYLNIDIEPADDFDQFFRLLAKIETKHVRKQFSSRLSELIREMLKHPRLREMVRNFLNDLIKTRYGDIALEIVVEITERLQFAPHFDPLFWLKRFLNQSNQETRNEAYFALLSLARKRGFRIYEILETIRSWLPEPASKTNNYSLSEKCALAFIIDYCISLRFEIEKYGEWSSRYPLFATLKENDNSKDPEPRLRFLIQWLFHPGIKIIFGESADKIIADLIEEWITILYGFKKDASHSGAIALSEALLKLVVSESEDNQQKALLRRWLAKPRLYLNEIKKLRHTTADTKKYLEEKEQFISRRAIVLDLVLQFKKFQRKK